MKIKRDCVLSYLQEERERAGGYTGTDLVELAEVLGVTYMAIWKGVSKWVKEDPTFANLTYLGRYRPSVTLNEFLEIEERLQSNPLEVKSHILSDLRDIRKIKGEKAIPTSTFYRQTALNEYKRSFLRFSEVLREVSRHVREDTPDWFAQHDRLFRKQTDGVFYMEYNEEEFAEMRDFMMLSDFSAETYAIGIRSNSGTLSIPFNAT